MRSVGYRTHGFNEYENFEEAVIMVMATPENDQTTEFVLANFIKIKIAVCARSRNQLRSSTVLLSD